MDTIDAQGFNVSPNDVVFIVPGERLSQADEHRLRDEIHAFNIRAVLLPAGTNLIVQPPLPKYFEAQTMDGKTIKVLIDD